MYYIVPHDSEFIGHADIVETAGSVRKSLDGTLAVIKTCEGKSAPAGLTDPFTHAEILVEMAKAEWTDE